MSSRASSIRGRPAPFEHRVAERTVHRVEDRRSHQERALVLLEAGKALRPEVVGEIAVVAREIGVSPIPDRERGQIEARRPPFGAVEQVGNLIVAELDPRGPQQAVRFAAAESDQVGPDLEQPPLRTDRRDRKTERAAARRARASNATECAPRGRRESRPTSPRSAATRRRARARAATRPTAIAAASLGTAAVQTERLRVLRAFSAARSSGVTRSIAAAMWRSRTTGSLSRSSIDTHANGRSSRSAHCARIVVFPEPAGATSVTSGNDCEARRRLMIAVRETLPGRGAGTSTFAGTWSNGSSRLALTATSASIKRTRTPPQECAHHSSRVLPAVCTPPDHTGGHGRSRLRKARNRFR